MICESSETDLLATTARRSASVVGDSTRALTRRSCFSARGSVEYIDWLRLWVDWLFILNNLDG